MTEERNTIRFIDYIDRKFKKNPRRFRIKLWTTVITVYLLPIVISLILTLTIFSKAINKEIYHHKIWVPENSTMVNIEEWTEIPNENTFIYRIVYKYYKKKLGENHHYILIDKEKIKYRCRQKQIIVEAEYLIPREVPISISSLNYLGDGNISYELKINNIDKVIVVILGALIGVLVDIVITIFVLIAMIIVILFQRAKNKLKKT